MELQLNTTLHLMDFSKKYFKGGRIFGPETTYSLQIIKHIFDRMTAEFADVLASCYSVTACLKPRKEEWDTNDGCKVECIHPLSKDIRLIVDTTQAPKIAINITGINSTFSFDMQARNRATAYSIEYSAGCKSNESVHTTTLIAFSDDGTEKDPSSSLHAFRDPNTVFGKQDVWTSKQTVFNEEKILNHFQASLKNIKSQGQRCEPPLKGDGEEPSAGGKTSLGMLAGICVASAIGLGLYAKKKRAAKKNDSNPAQTRKTSEQHSKVAKSRSLKA
jgi:hypothetical protein